MASNDLIIDKDYFIEMKNYLESEGKLLDSQLSVYISILENASKSGLISGMSAARLKIYVHNAKRLKGKFKPAADDAVKAMRDLLETASKENDRKM